ncbi:MAG: hypothetical protein A3E51_14975 [Burkholderiales bacterium RIFCSPHIGHO2_12_FULL_67_38]|nr:MAG: hypothetical protein A3I64_14820 [Burkholderiales bacterium RIFCSPLOWO2_02_FULL_67_64]OGB49886.1 MAG: hypothetical protein A3E51_14975 [Burkholderiales bacterium RIFCSPHIGHO2_12_FULL_67_38]OGB86007.1 MAG: hypothetical protein A3G82_26295 [Burkholderiales bacterium RIFCSPLOWO2_12_FULL_67_210]
MRHLLIACLIALLPLRGWVGDAMAVSMFTAPDQGAAHAGCAENLAPPALATALQAPTAHGMAPQDAPTAQAQDDGTQTHSACDVCNGAAMGLPTPRGEPARQTHPLLAPQTVRFASSEPQRGHKPPIS